MKSPTLNDIRPKRYRCYARIMGLSLISMVMLACGSSKSAVNGNGNSSTLSSRLPIDDINLQFDGPVADCSGATNVDLGLEFQLSSYYIPATGEVSIDLVRMNFTKVPSRLITAESVYIQMFRWHEDTPGQRQVNQAPVKFLFQSKQTGKIVNQSEPQDRLSKAVIQNMMIKSKNAGSTGLSINNFFQAHIIILTGMDIEFDALSVAVYDTDLGSESTGWQDALIPAFYARPADYAASHPAPSLQELHPNWPQRNAGWSDLDYFNNTELFCQKFL